MFARSSVKVFPLLTWTMCAISLRFSSSLFHLPFVSKWGWGLGPRHGNESPVNTIVLWQGALFVLVSKIVEVN